MAAQEPILVPSPAFSTIIVSCGIDRSIHKTDTAIESAEQDVQFKEIHGMSRTDWDAALSLHQHGDLQ